MSNQKLTYTKAIKNGKLKATEMQIGESVTGTLKGFKENQYGTANVILEVQGRDVEIFSAGNLKFIAKDVDDGKRQLGAFTTITRVDDVQTKNGMTSTKFAISQTVVSNNNAAAPVTTTSTTKDAVKAELAQIRANRSSN